MYIAEKGNWQFHIQRHDIEAFVKEGYDIFTEEGNRIRIGAGKIKSQKEKEREAPYTAKRKIE